MKKLMAMIFLVLMVAMFATYLAPKADAGFAINGVAVTASTFTCTGTFPRSSLPAGAILSSTTYANMEIYDLDIFAENADPHFYQQTVKVYEKVGSTNTMNCVWKVVLSSGVTAGNIYQKHFDPPLQARDGIYLQSSDPNTAVIGSFGWR